MRGSSIYWQLSHIFGRHTLVQVIRETRDAVQQTRGVQKVNEVLTMHVGPGYILVNLSVEFSDSIRTG